MKIYLLKLRWLRCQGNCLLLCLLFGLLPGTLAASINEAFATDSISLDEAVVLTLSKNPELRAFNVNLQVHEGRIQQAALSPRPELEVTLEDALGTGAAQGLSAATATVSIAWVLEGGLRQKRIGVARAGSLALAAQADVKRLDAAAETARYFIEALAQQMQREIADQALALAAETVSVLEARVNAGTALTAELLRAQAALAQHTLYREDVDHGLQAAYHRLAAQWGELTPSFSSVEGDALDLPVLEPFDRLRERMERNPDLLSYLSEQRVNQAELLLEQARQHSLWRFNVGLRRLQNTSDTALVAGVIIPLDRGKRNQGRITEARANLERSVADEEAARVRMQTGLLVLYLELEHNIHQVSTLSNDVIPLFEQALQESLRAYQLGRYSYLEWLLAQNDVLDARRQQADASVQAHLRMIEIERLTGVRLVPASLYAEEKQ